MLPAGGGQLLCNGLSLALCSSHLGLSAIMNRQLDCFCNTHNIVQCQTKTSQLLTQDKLVDKGNKEKSDGCSNRMKRHLKSEGLRRLLESKCQKKRQKVNEGGVLWYSLH